MYMPGAEIRGGPGPVLSLLLTLYLAWVEDLQDTSIIEDSPKC